MRVRVPIEAQEESARALTYQRGAVIDEPPNTMLGRGVVAGGVLPEPSLPPRVPKTIPAPAAAPAIARTFSIVECFPAGAVDAALLCRISAMAVISTCLARTRTL